MTKLFVMEPTPAEPIELMPEHLARTYVKGDGYDEMREKIWHKHITVPEFEKNLLALEQTITAIKQKEKDEVIDFNTIFTKPGKGPLEDRVIILPDAAEAVTKTGIVIPTGSQSAPARGTVIAVGPGLPSKMQYELVGYFSNGTVQPNIVDGADPIYKLLAMPVRVGDKVLYGKQAGLPIEDPEKTDGKKYLVMRLADVWVKV